MRKVEPVEPVEAPPDVTPWSEMSQVKRDVRAMKSMLARLEGITAAGDPLVCVSMVDHLKRTVGGYKLALVRAATMLVSSITRLESSTPGE